MVDYQKAGITKLWYSHRPHLLELIADEEKEASYRLKSLLEVIGTGVAIFDKDRKFVWINEKYKKQIKNQRGYLPKIKGRKCDDIFRKKNMFYPDYHVVVKTLKTGKVQIAEEKYTSFDGKTHYYELHGAPIKDKEGNIIGALLLRRGITKERKLEIALKYSEERYKHLFENVNAGVNITTPGEKGNFVDVNPTFVKLFGYKDKEELLRTNVCDLYQNPSDREKFNEKMLKYGYVKNEILKLKRRDGTPFLARENAVAIKDENGNVKYFYCITEDITESKRS